jgi:hypothetical protein
MGYRNGFWKGSTSRSLQSSGMVIPPRCGTSGCFFMICSVLLGWVWMNCMMCAPCWSGSTSQGSHERTWSTRCTHHTVHSHPSKQHWANHEETSWSPTSGRNDHSTRLERTRRTTFPEAISISHWQAITHQQNTRDQTEENNEHGSHNDNNTTTNTTIDAYTTTTTQRRSDLQATQHRQISTTFRKTNTTTEDNSTITTVTY